MIFSLCVWSTLLNRTLFTQSIKNITNVQLDYYKTYVTQFSTMVLIKVEKEKPKNYIDDHLNCNVTTKYMMHVTRRNKTILGPRLP